MTDVVTIAESQVPVNRTRGGELRVLLSPKTVGSTGGFMGTMTLGPGEWIGEHYHPYSEEYLYLSHGTIVLRLDGVERELRGGEALVIPMNVRHRVENRGDVVAGGVFTMCPLAPSPELGHVNTEPLPAQSTPDSRK